MKCTEIFYITSVQFRRGCMSGEWQYTPKDCECNYLHSEEKICNIYHYSYENLIKFCVCVCVLSCKQLEMMNAC